MCQVTQSDSETGYGRTSASRDSRLSRHHKGHTRALTRRGHAKASHRLDQHRLAISEDPRSARGPRGGDAGLARRQGATQHGGRRAHGQRRRTTDEHARCSGCCHNGAAMRAGDDCCRCQDGGGHQVTTPSDHHQGAVVDRDAGAVERNRRALSVADRDAGVADGNHRPKPDTQRDAASAGIAD